MISSSNIQATQFQLGYRVMQRFESLEQIETSQIIYKNFSFPFSSLIIETKTYLLVDQTQSISNMSILS